MDLILRSFLVLCIFDTCFGIDQITWPDRSTTRFNWKEAEKRKHFIDNDEFVGIQIALRQDATSEERAAATILLAANRPDVVIENKPEVKKVKRGKKRHVTGIKFRDAVGRTLHPKITIGNNVMNLSDVSFGNTIFSDLNCRSEIQGNELFTRTHTEPWLTNGARKTKVYYNPNEGNRQVGYKPAFQISYEKRNGGENLVDAALSGHITVTQNDFPFIFSGGIGNPFEIGHYEARPLNNLNQITNKERWNECISKLC